MRENTPLRTWRAGGQTVGGWLSVGNAYTAEVMANAGFDWLCVDLQHGMLSYDDLTYMLPAISTSDTIPFVRVPWNEPYEIMKALDAGAYGVIVPMVNNREEGGDRGGGLPLSARRQPLLRSHPRGHVRRTRLCARGQRARSRASRWSRRPKASRSSTRSRARRGSTPSTSGRRTSAMRSVSDRAPSRIRSTSRPCSASRMPAGPTASPPASTAAACRSRSAGCSRGFNLVTLGSDSGFMGARRAGATRAGERRRAAEERESTGY